MNTSIVQIRIEFKNMTLILHLCGRM